MTIICSSWKHKGFKELVNKMKRIEQASKEKIMLDELFSKKSKVEYKFEYRSSSLETSDPRLGTIEADAAGHYGRWRKESFRAEKLAVLCSSIPKVNKILDVGGGNLLAASYFSELGYDVDVSDFGTSPYISDEALETSGISHFYDGDFNTQVFSKKYDLVWASHVLEHQENVKIFLDKITAVVKDCGYLAIAVPPRKPFIVSGHVNLFNPGLLIYRLVLSGIDCSAAKVFQYDGNICVLLRYESVTLPQLTYDIGDIENLSHLFPFLPTDGFNGDFTHVNLSEKEISLIYG